MAGGHACRGMRVGETAMETDGTHPTGMHSCPLYIFTPSTQGLVNFLNVHLQLTKTKGKVTSLSGEFLRSLYKGRKAK